MPKKLTICPNCGEPAVAVIESRDTKVEGVFTVRRRKECKLCNYKYTTYELPIGIIEYEQRVRAFRKALNDISVSLAFTKHMGN